MNVRVLYAGSIYDRNGAAKVVRSFAENRQLFHAYCGHDVLVFDKSFAEEKSQGVESDDRPNLRPIKTVKRWMKSFLGKDMMEKYAKSYMGTKRFIENYIWNSRRVFIGKYYGLGLNDDAFVFHDIYTCWAYVDQCQRNNLELKKFILVLHNNGEMYKMTLINHPNIKGRWYHKVMNKRAEACYGHAQRIVFVSETSAKVFKHYHSKYAEKVSVVYNGIHDNVQDGNPVFDGKIRMVTVGTVGKRKNQVILIDCLKMVRKHWDATLTVIGGGDALEECKHRAKDLNLEQWVTFLGSIDDVANELTKCNLFVMSSLDEGLPIAAIEALRAKLPVILTDVGGCQELINDNGYLVKPNIEDISNAIIEFGRNVDKQKGMSEASYRLFKEKYTLDAMIRGYSQIIKDVLS